MPDHGTADIGRSHRVWIQWVLGLLVGVYLFAFRVHGVDSSFALLDEQVRDWSVAQRPFDKLPWIGPRSVNSGLDIGPVYYRFLWAARVVVGPLADNLPHAGAWAISALQSVGDVVLFIALWRRLASGWLAAAIVVAAGSATLDAHLSSTIWNPPVAVALVKLASAACLWSHAPTAPTAALAVAFSAFAVQAHFSAAVVAGPIVLTILWAVWRRCGAREMVPALAAGAVVTAAWLIPYAMTPPEAPSATRTGAVSSVAAAVQDPLSRLRVRDSSAAVAEALEFLVSRPFALPWLRWAVLLGATIVAIGMRRAALTAVSAAPIAVAVAVFALWQGQFGEVYWFMVLGPAALVCLVAPVAALPANVRRVVTAAVIMLVVFVQPPRAREAWSLWRTPQYGVVVAGLKSIVANDMDVRAIALTFDVPPGMDVYFLHALLGGKLNATGVVARIDQSGTVKYE